MNINKVRPAIHFSPQKGWMNDPNGPVYFNGEYHIFFQHNPNDVCWDSMHWGHARSKDLMHWEELPIALYPDEQGMIFSGCSFVDEENITGFGSSDALPVLLFYTSHDEKTNFDGNTFIADKEQDKTLLVDYGPDFYAGTIFSNTKDIILIAWLGDFSPAAKKSETEKEGFKGILSFPRKLQLKKTNAGYRLCHSFIEGVKNEESVSYERITGEENITGDKNAIAEETVIVEESITDGCVKEVIKEGGFTAFTAL